MDAMPVRKFVMRYRIGRDFPMDAIPVRKTLDGECAGCDSGTFLRP
jgi:hypothetical protein